MNGLWHFLPLDSGKVTLPPTVYPGFMKVPGLWRQNSFTEFFFRPKTGGVINTYDGKPLTKYDNAWYERTFDLGSEAKNKTILLRFNRIMADAVMICINGKEVFRAEDPLSAIELDVTRSVKPGKNSVAVFCVKSSAKSQAADLSGAMVSRQYALGILDDVELLIRPRTSLGKALIATSYDTKELKVKYFIDNNSNARNAELKVSVEQNGKTVFRAGSMKLHLKKGHNSALFQSKWATPILWQPDDPQMCDLKLELCDTNGKLLDSRKYPFGFRDVVAKNGHIYINGIKRFFRFETSALNGGWQSFSNNSNESIVKYFTVLKMNGFNGIRYCFGRGVLNRQVFEIADRMGIMIWAFPFERGHKERDNADAAFWKKYEAEIKGGVETLHNHPSIFMWVSDNWYNMQSGFAWPQLLGENFIRNPKRTAHLLNVDKLFKKYDLSNRPVSGSTDAWYGGETYSAHPYFGFHFQAQERNDWPEHWAKKKQFPLVTGEFGLPYVTDYRHVANRPLRHRYPLESVARYLGNDAYLYAEGTDLTATTHTKVPGESHAYRVISQGRGKPFLYFCNPAIVEQKTLFGAGLFYWRIYGVSVIGLFDELVQYNSSGMVMNRYDIRGVTPAARDDFSAASGLKPDAYCGFPYGFWLSDPLSKDVRSRPTMMHYMFRSVYAPLAARIVGHKAHFTSVTANYFGGEKVEKQIAVVNHTGKDADVSASWVVRDRNGGIRASGEKEITAPCGETTMIPLEFTLPAAVHRTNYTIELTARENGKVFARDSFKLNVFPRDAALKLEKQLYLFDTDGETAAMLKRAGVEFTKINDPAEVPNGAVLIVGRRSINAALRFSELLDRGVNIVSFEQKGITGQVILEEVRQRYAFPQAEDHPVFDGLKTEDFRNWRGETDMLVKYPPLPEGKWYGHWGTEGIVCTGALQKPPVASGRVLAACDFDLRAAAMIEYYGKNGRYILCQFDVTDKYGVEPAATKLVNNIFRYLDGPFDNTLNDLIVIGSAEKTVSALDQVNAVYEKADTVRPLTPRTVAALDGTADFSELSTKWDLPGHAYNGGTVLVFVREDMDIKRFPFFVKAEKQTVRFGRTANSTGLLAGISNADLYWRHPFPVFVLDIPQKINAPSPAIFAEVPFGAGRFVFVGFDPADAPEKPDCWAKEKSTRVLSTLLSNLHVPRNISLSGGDVSLSGLDLEDVKWKFANAKNVKGETWKQPDFNDTGWHTVKRGPWNRQVKGFELGTGLYRIRFKTPAGFRDQDLEFVCGKMVDVDETFLNGIKIGETTWKDNTPWLKQRNYAFSGKLLKPEGEENVLAVKVFVGGANGGIISKPVWIVKKPHKLQQEFQYQANMETCY